MSFSRRWSSIGAWRSRRSSNGISRARFSAGGDRVGLMRIDDQRAVELLRRAGELRQHQHAGIVRILRREIFLGDKVHAVAQRRHHADVGGAIKAGQNGARIGPVDVADRRPGRVAKTAVDLADEAGHLGFDLAILLDLGAALRRDLQQRHPAAPFGIVLEQPFERLDAVGYAFRIVEPIDAKHEAVAAEALAHQRRPSPSARRCARGAYRPWFRC